METGVPLAVRDHRAVVRRDQFVINDHLFGIQQVRFYDRPETEQSVAVRCETGVGHEVADADFGLRDDRDVAFDAGARRFDLILKRCRNRMGAGLLCIAEALFVCSEPVSELYRARVALRGRTLFG